MSGLLACPFCGGLPEIHGRTTVVVRCLDCGSRGQEINAFGSEVADGDTFQPTRGDAIREAVTRWNRRAAP
jgi:hypothetical protein